MTSRPVAQGAYTPARLDGDRVVSAGMTPRDDQQVLVASGTVGPGGDVTVEHARALAELAGQRAVDACVGVLPEGAHLAEAIWMTVYVRSTAELEDHSVIADGASEAVESRVEGQRPVRAAVGVISLPGGAPVEVQLGCRWTTS